MPDFEITDPSGRRFIITAPEGASQEDVLRYAQQNAPPAEPPPERGVGEAAVSAGTQFGAGANSRIAGVVGAPVDLVGRGLRAVGLPIPEDALGGSRSIQRGFDALLGSAPAPQTTSDRLARGAGEGLVDAASFALPAAGIARATAATGGVAPSLLNRSATALAAQPGLQAAAGMAGGAVSEATDSPLAGFLASMAVPLGAAAGGRLITPIRPPPNAAREALVRAAEREGIPVTAGQATGNAFLRNVESQLEQLPLTSGPARGAREAQQAAFTRAALQRAGTSADNAGPEVLNQTRQRIGGVFNDLTARNNLNLDDVALSQFARVENDLTQNALPEVARIANNRMQQVINAAGADGQVPGTFYRQMDSAIGRQMRETGNGDLRTALGQVRDALREAMDRSISPADSAAWAQARRQYANFAALRQVMGGAGAGVAEGQISPLALRGALDRSTGRGYAEGRGDLNELARIGQSIVRAPNDSGTAGRTLAQNVLTGSIPATGGVLGTMLGGPVGGVVGAGASLALPRLVQAMMNSAAGQAYLRNQVVRNPQMTGPLSAALLGQQGLAQVTGP